MKKLFIALAILVIAGAATAFTVQSGTKVEPNTGYIQEWFIFNGLPNEVDDPTKYSLDPTLDCPNNGTKRCGVYATRVTASSPVIPNFSLSYSIYTKQ